MLAGASLAQENANFFDMNPASGEAMLPLLPLYIIFKATGDKRMHTHMRYLLHCAIILACNNFF